IWLVPTDGSAAPRKLTGAQSARLPRWTPDGSVLGYVASAVDTPQTPSQNPQNPQAAQSRPDPANARTQVYTIAPNGGEPTRVTNIKAGASRFTWSPDGSRLACVAKASPAQPPDSDPWPYRSTAYKADRQRRPDARRSHLV